MSMPEFSAGFDPEFSQDFSRMSLIWNIQTMLRTAQQMNSDHVSSMRKAQQPTIERYILDDVVSKDISPIDTHRVNMGTEAL